jgi:hypothetical protein
VKGRIMIVPKLLKISMLSSQATLFKIKYSRVGSLLCNA